MFRNFFFRLKSIKTPSTAGEDSIPRFESAEDALTLAYEPWLTQDIVTNKPRINIRFIFSYTR